MHRQNVPVHEALVTQPHIASIFPLLKCTSVARSTQTWVLERPFVRKWSSVLYTCSLLLVRLLSRHNAEDRYLIGLLDLTRHLPKWLSKLTRMREPRFGKGLAFPWIAIAKSGKIVALVCFKGHATSLPSRPHTAGRKVDS